MVAALLLKGRRQCRSHRDERSSTPCAACCSRRSQEAAHRRRKSEAMASLDETVETKPSAPNQCVPRVSNGFAAQEARMRAASAARWAEDELFSLKNAFDLQLKRLEVNQENKREGCICKTLRKGHARLTAISARGRLSKFENVQRRRKSVCTGTVQC